MKIKIYIIVKLKFIDNFGFNYNFNMKKIYNGWFLEILEFYNLNKFEIVIIVIIDIIF